MQAGLLWLASLLAIPLAYVCVVTVGIAGATVIAELAGRRLPRDAVQAEAFAHARAGLFARMWGILAEGYLQALAFAKQTLHAMRLLPAPPRRPGATPVVVLPGYTENAGTMHSLGARLGDAGYDPILLDFPSTFSPVEKNARWLGERLRALRAELGVEAVLVVGHSMGGLIARTLIHSEHDHGIAALAAFASPFRGTQMAHIGAFFKGGRSSHDMRPGSDYFTRFPWTAAEPVPILSLVAFQEDIISPPWNSILPGADNVVLPRPYGHEAPLFLPSAFAILDRWLERHRAATRPAVAGAVTDTGAATGS